MDRLPIFMLLIYIYIGICWVVNLVQFFTLDFEPSYKAEIIKGIGIFVVPASGVTVWF